MALPSICDQFEPIPVNIVTIIDDADRFELRRHVAQMLRVAEAAAPDVRHQAAEARVAAVQPGRFENVRVIEERNLGVSPVDEIEDRGDQFFGLESLHRGRLSLPGDVNRSSMEVLVSPAFRRRVER